MQIQEHISLAKYTTYKLGGPARYFAEPASVDELREALEFARAQGIPHFILGKGSNLVVSDHGYPGLVIYMGRTFKEIRFDGELVECEAGALLHSVVTQSVKRGLAGIQNLGGIPGTMGGGVYINAGAFDQELVQTVESVESVDVQTGEIRLRTGAQCQFSYRHSLYFDLNEVITRVWLRLKLVDQEALEAEMNETLRKRKSKQPLEFPNAGSMYKRPLGTYAGKLIEEAELKGFRMGGAQISPMHANFVINVGDCKAQDVFDLSEEVVLRVQAQSGIKLEKEQIFLGDFLPWPR